MKQLMKAVLKTMEDIKGVEKNLEVGTGRYSYKGVSDQDVKKIVGRAMQKHGLALFPIHIRPQEQIDRWEEDGRTRQSITTIVNPIYRLMHESGESIDIEGYGHGIDSGDKSAGKATTYALKYTMLYLFQVPTGNIDDSDQTHSDQIPAPAKKPNRKTEKPWMSARQLDDAMTYLRNGGTLEMIESKYRITKPHRKTLEGLADDLKKIKKSEQELTEEIESEKQSHGSKK